MDMELLRESLRTGGVPKWAYSINEIKENADCLVPDGISWATFFLEKGSQFDRKLFASESEACLFFERKLLSIDFNTGMSKKGPASK